MPAARFAAKNLLVSMGVDAAVGVAWRFDPDQIKAVVARWEGKRAAGEDLGAGWIVWRLKQGPIKMAKPKKRTELDWMEERWKRDGGKGTLR